MAEVLSVQAALAKVKKAVGAVGKEQRNTAQNFRFRGIDDVVNAVSGPLADEGVITTPAVLSYTYETVEVGKNHTQMAHVIGTVQYTFTGPAGDALFATVLSESMDSGDKAVAKMMSVAYRIALLQVLTLPTDSPDPDDSSYERSSKTEPAPPSRPAPRTRKPAGAADVPAKTAQEFADYAATLTDVAPLRIAFTDSGLAGVRLQVITIPGTEEKLQLEKYLMRRGDELSLPKSGPPAAGNAGGEGSQ